MKRTFIIAAALAAATAAAGMASAWQDEGTTRTSTNTMRGVESRLEGVVSNLETEATRLGDATFTERFATQFGVTVDVLTQQRTQYGVEWGDLFLAYSIQSASKTTLTLDQIFQMRGSGSTWTQIARSVKVPVGKLMHSVQSRLDAFRTESTTGARTGGGSGSGRTGAISGLDRQIDTRLASLDEETSRLGDQATAERLSQEFGVTVDVLNQQRTQFNADWSDLLVGYSILEQSRTAVTLEQIFSLRESGQTWTQIARSLRIPPGKLLRSIRTQTQTLTSSKTTRGGEAVKTARGGGTAAMKTTKGGGTATMRAGGAAAARVSTTTLHGQGSLMRAAARGSMTTHGRK